MVLTWSKTDGKCPIVGEEHILYCPEAFDAITDPFGNEKRQKGAFL